MQTPIRSTPQHPKTGAKEFLEALNRHLYNAKLIVYSSLLVVGVTQIVIREQFPELHPPWPLIGGALILILVGVIFLPPLVLVAKKKE